MKNSEFFIPDDGIRLHAKLDFPQNRKSEKLPLLILIHGFTGHMEEDHILAVRDAANEAGYAVLRAEMYGHGLSGGAFRDHTLFKWMSNAMAVIDYARQLDFVDGLYLAGHSQGGLLTMLTGAMEGDRLRAILPLSPAAMIPDGARRGELLGMPFDPDHIPAEIQTDKEEYILGENYVRTARMIDVEAAIPRYRGPVLLVHGSGDESVPMQCSVDAAKLYENAKLVIIPDDTHCYDLHLDMVAAAVKDFLLSVRNL